MTPSNPAKPTTTELDQAIAAALARIPPLWPLRHFVAVNPFAHLADRPFAEACGLLQRADGVMPLQTPADYLALWRQDLIRPEDLALASDDQWSTEQLIAGLAAAQKEAPPKPIPTFADWLDQSEPHAHWTNFVTEEIAKWCAVYFDDNQTTWRSPWRQTGLFAAWRESAQCDANAEVFGLHGFRTYVARLPMSARECIATCMPAVKPAAIDATDFLHRQLATISGWAGYAQYLVREDSMRGKTNPLLSNLLAIRLAYDAALLSAFGSRHTSGTHWLDVKSPPANLATTELLLRWQLAYEHGYQRQLAHDLVKQNHAASTQRPAAQAIFCIDVRSEILRRNLEQAAPGVQTLGFAGFFAFPVAHQSSPSSPPGSRCPALLVPPVETFEPRPADAARTIATDEAEYGAWKAFQNSATSCFSFVETMGLGFAAALGQGQRSRVPQCERTAPAFGLSTDISTRAAFAENALRYMSLTKNFARLVLVCGHGSQSANNPYASSLDCGACGGHAGDVNARLAADTLNDPAVRAILSGHGIDLPSDTVFIAGLHQTMTDEVILFDLEKLPETHAGDVAALRQNLAQAAHGARAERSAALGLAHLKATELIKALSQRSRDIAEVRPEWGLANNAALIAAPRRRTRALNLQGRAFLHDYEPADDPENKVLTLILCAPVVVGSWINLQYYASRVNPAQYGSGNKVLHNVMGGIGVAEGNGGDLRVGLPLQSIHDGKRFVHEPRRLSVYIESPTVKIDAVLRAQPQVRQLFDHGWIHLFALDGPTCLHYRAGKWTGFDLIRPQ
jgi:uncharacterized protein YbcC (UPF0753/DUF2309 family)